MVLSVTTRAQVTVLQHVMLLLNKKKALLVDGFVEIAMSTHEMSENSKDTIGISPTTRQLLTTLPTHPIRADGAEKIAPNFPPCSSVNPLASLVSRVDVGSNVEVGLGLV